MKIAIIGTGYVGLVSGTCFAELGMHVTCVDNQHDKVNALQRGDVPIYEPGLSEMVARNVAAGRLHFTTDLKAAIQEANVISIAVGTPTRPHDGFADLSYVYGVAGEIAKTLDHYAVIVTKSTVPAGTGHEIIKIIARENPTLDFDVASNPEFLREGCAVDDFMHPDRVVIGVDTPRAKEVMSQLYKPFSDRGVPVFFTRIISSELIKYAANTFLATKVSFINEMADLCESLGANIEDVAHGIGLDSRIGSKFLKAGPGYGGSCFPKDTLAMVGIGERALSPVTIVEAVIGVNRQRQHRMVAKIMDACGGMVEGKKIAFLGVAFKAETDDVRDSVALLIAETLARKGAHVAAYDPKAMANALKVTGPIIDYVATKEEALREADIVVIATEWQEFRTLEIPAIRKMLKHPVMVDLRNLFSPEDMQRQEFAYYSIGRPAVHPEPRTSQLKRVGN
jgi:UDPglucose 6-dehydrogenase